MLLMHAFAVSRRRLLCWLGCSLAVCLSGCRDRSSAGTDVVETSRPAVPIRILVVEDAGFAEALQRQWTARTQNELQLQQLTLDELEDLKRLEADVVLYPSAALGTLAERQLLAPPSESVLNDPSYRRQEVFDLQRNAEVKWGNQTLAFSFGSPQFVLCYRADLFAALKLEVPRTWADYERLISRLERDALGDFASGTGDDWAPLCEPLGPTWAGKLLLARAAAYAAHPSQFSILFDYATMQPLIAGPPFVRALTELVNAAKTAPDTMLADTPETARQRLFGGQVAMAICWPHQAPPGAESIPLAEGVRVAFAPLPGATEAYDFGERQWTDRDADRATCVPLTGIAGKLGSVTHNARRPLEAAGILALLTGEEWSETLSPVSPDTTLFRTSHLANPTIWTDKFLSQEASDNYAQAASATQELPVHVSSLRIPGFRRYLEVLDRAVQAAVAGNASPQEALTAAAGSWDEITDQLGRDSQSRAYARSLGLEP